MKHIIIIVVVLAIFVYHVKNTNYDLSVYLLQIFLGLFTYKLLVKFRERKSKKGLPK